MGFSGKEVKGSLNKSVWVWILAPPLISYRLLTNVWEHLPRWLLWGPTGSSRKQKDVPPIFREPGVFPTKIRREAQPTSSTHYSQKVTFLEVFPFFHFLQAHLPSSDSDRNPAVLSSYRCYLLACGTNIPCPQLAASPNRNHPIASHTYGGCSVSHQPVHRWQLLGSKSNKVARPREGVGRRWLVSGQPWKSLHARGLEAPGRTQVLTGTSPWIAWSVIHSGTLNDGSKE